jgi:hypothetical protein
VFDDLPTISAQLDDQARVELLRASYSEVLDATKHQDDKIGRLLTAIAFLTAASLALASLATSPTLVRRFVVSGAPRGPQHLPPLVLITLATFLVCVVLAVVLLVDALATPLRIPGLGHDVRQKRVSLGDFSQIYFYDIAGLGRDEWQRKWSAGRAALRAELAPMYRNETHNLAVRVDFKYARTNEAVAILSLGLLAFGATVLLFFAAVTAPCRGVQPAGTCSSPVEFGAILRATLATLLGLYVFGQLLVQFRQNHMTVDRARNLLGEARHGAERRREWWRATRQRTFIVLAALGTSLPLSVPFTSRHGAWAYWPSVAALGVAALLYVLTTYTPADRASNRRLRDEREKHYTFAPVIAGLLAALVLVSAAEATGDFAWQLLAAAVLPAALTVAALLAPTGHAAERRASYLARLTAADAG